jgi:hypothetical protein
VYALVRKLRRNQVQESENLSFVLQRWRTAEVGADSNGPEQGWVTALPLNEELSCYLAALYGRKLASEGNADHDEIMYRCAKYANARLAPDDFEKFYERDRDVFVMAALLNDGLLRDWRTRRPLESYISAENQPVFEARVKDLRSRGYFTEEPAGASPVAANEPDELRFARDSHNQIMYRLEALRSSIISIGWTLVAGVALGLWLWRR